jgi:hypothetical protein
MQCVSAAIAALVAGSAGAESWQRMYGGRLNDYGDALLAVADGYVVAGSTASFGSGVFDIGLFKLDAGGDVVWNRAFGGTDLDDASALGATCDGGFVVAGSTYSFGAGARDIYLIKTDVNGIAAWTKTYGGAGTDVASDVVPLSDCGIAVVGLTDSFGAGARDIHVVRTDTDGNALWARTFGGAADDIAGGAVETADGGLLVAGFTSSFGAGGSDVYLVKIDANGNEEWSKTIGGPGDEAGSGILAASDGGFVVVGRAANPVTGELEAYLLMVDASGNEVWSQAYAGRYGDTEGRSVKETADGFVLACVTASSRPVGRDFCLLKTDTAGIEEWRKTFFGSDTVISQYDVAVTPDGGCAAVGSTDAPGAKANDVYFVYYKPGAPQADVKVNGSDGPVTIRQGEKAHITAWLDAADRTGVNVDWWVLARTPSGTTWHYEFGLPGVWLPGRVPANQGLLLDYGPQEIDDSTLLNQGNYRFYFGVDWPMNGVVDRMQVADFVDVTVVPAD